MREDQKRRFMVKRKTQATRLVRKLKALREDMLRRMHTPVREQHRWLCQVLRGHYQYYGVIFNYSSLRAFKDCVVRLWRKTLGKRSQKGRVTCGRMPSRIMWKWPERVVSGVVRLTAVRRRGQAGRPRRASRPGSASRRPSAL